MKFAHVADVHIGAWRDPAMKDLSLEAFIEAIKIIIEEKVDFVIIAGDLFNTALPLVDHLKEVIRQLKKLEKAQIPVYYIAGSHDFSPSGKTMLDILEETGLATNVCKGKVEGEKLQLEFIKDQKTGIKFCGIQGEKGMLDKHQYEMLDKELLEKEEGEKIFLFHTSITEMKPKELEEMDSHSVKFMPQGFNYYAGGHVHIRKEINPEGYSRVIYPGPVFPCNFSELEKLDYGTFIIVENWEPKSIPLKIKPVKKIEYDAERKTPENITNDLIKWVEQTEMNNAIVLLRVKGKITQGSIADIDFKRIGTEAESKGAHFVMRNTSKLTSEELKEVEINSSSAEEIENQIFKEHEGQIKVGFNEKETANKLLKVLSQEKNEGEKNYEYEKRIIEETKNTI